MSTIHKPIAATLILTLLAGTATAAPAMQEKTETVERVDDAVVKTPVPLPDPVPSNLELTAGAEAAQYGVSSWEVQADGPRNLVLEGLDRHHETIAFVSLDGTVSLGDKSIAMTDPLGEGLYHAGIADLEANVFQVNAVFGWDIDWRKTANCTANAAGLAGMAIAAAAAVVLAALVIAEIAAGAGAGTAIAAAWADVVTAVGGIATAADIGAAAALLYQRFGNLQTILAGLGATAAAWGITQAAKDRLDGALNTLRDYATGWKNYADCCLSNIASACGNMPFNVF